jgi:molybdopterin converting factor subunit 1
MKVTVRLFATLRQQAGWAQQTVTLPDSATVETLMTALEAQNQSLTLRHRSVYAAVNQAYVGIDTVLHDGDEVALMPPVSGGG